MGRNCDYVLGKADPWKFADRSLGSDIIGVQLKNHVESITRSYRDIDGYVAITSTVKVYVNDDFEKELSTYGGYYSLKNLYYGNGEVKKVKIDEVLADGITKEISVQKFDDNQNQQNVPKNDFIIGVTGMQNRLWANNGYIYQTQTKKNVLGFKHHKKISDKLTFDNFIIADKIFSGDANNSWGQSVLGNKKYLNYTTMRNLNALDGETYMGALTYKNNERVNSKLIFGASNSVSQDGITEGGLGYYLEAENNYAINKATNFKTSLFASSPNFYMAGSSSGGMSFMSDRVGASIGGNTGYKNLSLGGGYSKYKSNFSNYYDGGLIDFDEYSLYAKTTFKKLPSFVLKINNKSGQNELGKIISNSYELSGNKKLKCFYVNAGIRKNTYSNEYNADDYSSYSSEYSETFSDVNFPIGKKWGYGSLGYNMIQTTSDTVSNNYNVFRVGYATPSIKGFTFNISTGFRRGGINNGNDWGLGINKRLKSGSTVSLNYRYSQSPYYMIDNMYIPSSMRHSITIDFAELYGIGSRGLEPIGTGNSNKGCILASAFLDLNQDGIKGRGEPSIENVPIKVENSSEIFLTQKNGSTRLITADFGVYNVKIFEDELPTFLSCHNKTKPSRYVKINNHSKTKINFGLISSVGNINGSVTIKDEFNNSLKIEDLVVSVMDTTGKEMNYTNLNEDGTFSFSGLTPGKYVVAIDRELQNAYKIKPDAKTENYVVIIPPEYKDYVNIDNVNLNYKYQI